MTDVFLRIEDEILSVPRASLAISEVFDDMFQASHVGQSGESTRDNPIVLEGEKIADWRALIKVLVPMTTGGNMPTNLLIYDWRDSLKLATKYNMAPVRKRAIEGINGKDGYGYRHKLEWGLEYHVKSFIVEGAAEVVNSLLDSTLKLSLSMRPLTLPLSSQAIIKLLWIEKAMRYPESVQHSHPNPSRSWPEPSPNPLSIRFKYSSVKCRKNACPMSTEDRACLTCKHRHNEDETSVVTDWHVHCGIQVRLADIRCKQCSKSIYSKNWAAYYQCTTCKEKFHINQHFPVTRVYDINELIEEAFEEEIKLCY
ncbi:hypothetical protein DFP72DRAFT_909012 [Ephemerocybe angulata]|uniref:BTB domain-containing protein n=1 Tax=Ephemerocybe angulata TaxID=980116 RepID=A0A8H6HPX0_9AGAR|nr:hypothetical protein DFP72DRAFT_909012 [Tulosesus angulatus]